MTLVASVSGAATYDAEIIVDSQLDLYDLAEQGAITEDELEELLELYRNGVDLNSASRDDLYSLPSLGFAEVDAILSYRKLNGRIEDPADLVASGAITPNQLQQIAAFLLVGERADPLVPVSADLRYVSAFAASDPYAPPMYLHTRLKGPQNLSGGFIVGGTRRNIGSVVWDAGRNALAAPTPEYRLTVPKYYLQWKTAQRSAIGGTFRGGFAQRLTFDNSGRYTPDGFYPDQTTYSYSGPQMLGRQCDLSDSAQTESPCTEDEDTTYVTKDFRWREGMRGLAGSVRELELGSALVSLHAFGSYQSRSIYQYEIFSRNFGCTDPNGLEEACSAPDLYARYDDPSLPAPGQSYKTLPDVFTELSGGGHAGIALSPRIRFGLTSYYSQIDWKVPGANLDFQEYGDYPWNGPFGAVGADAALTFGLVNAYVEATRSFDSIPQAAGGGGGYGVIQRTTFGPKRQELEVSFRHYDAKFNNPYARAISQDDYYEGRRVRNETGVRLKYVGKPNEDWRLRGLVDVWTLPSDDDDVEGSAGTSNLELTGRADFIGWRWIELAGWTRFTDKDIGGDAFSCYATSETGDDAQCVGGQLSLVGRVTVKPFGQQTLAVYAQYQHKWLEDAFYSDEEVRRQDRGMWLGAIFRPMDNLRLRGGARYLNEDLNSPTDIARITGNDAVDRLNEWIWTRFDVLWAGNSRFETLFRYELLKYLDDRPATLARQPSPEHRFRLELEAHF